MGPPALVHDYVTMRRSRPDLATEQGLHEAALAYLDRRPTSREHLRRFLSRKVARGLGDAAPPREELDPMLARVLDRLAAARLLDDDAYAALRARALHRRGLPERAIQQKLRAKGLDSEAISGAVQRLAEEADDPDWVAACRFARRRRLGPFRVDGREASRERDLAAMGRAGFAYSVARRVIDAADADELLAVLREAT